MSAGGRGQTFTGLGGVTGVGGSQGVDGRKGERGFRYERVRRWGGGEEADVIE